MALVFPSSASIGETYQSGSSATYEYNGNYWEVSIPGNTLVSSSISSSLTVSASRSQTSSFAISSSVAQTSSLSVSASTTSFEYAIFTLSDYPTTAPNDITLVRNSSNSTSGITYSGTTVTLANPGVYRLLATLGIRTSSYAVYAWVDTSNNLLQGTVEGVSESVNSGDLGVVSPAGGIYKATVANTQIKLRLTGQSGILTTNKYPGYAHATIIQIK